MGRWWFSKIALEGEGQGRTQDRLVGSRSKEDTCCLSLVDLLLGGKAQRRGGHVVSLRRRFYMEFRISRDPGQPRSSRLFPIHPTGPGEAGTEELSG